jgi:linoleate 10R-lipoxygenase
MMFSFAVLVIHTCFRTSQEDWSINQTSSYVDLAPLYGNSEETQAGVRAGFAWKDGKRIVKGSIGRGHLKPDSFAEDRLLFLPPAASVMLVLFSRNHNYIADKLLAHNEKGTFNPDLRSLSQKDLETQDDELFNVARLVNCGWFGMIVMSDYFSTILGLCRFGSSWFLDPFEEIRKKDHSLVERGQGNAVTVEVRLEMCLSMMTDFSASSLICCIA